jgi:hypothetical protein
VEKHRGVIMDSYKGRAIKKSYPVRVYRNLTQDSLSIQYKGLVIGHASCVSLTNVRFKVYENGRQKVLEKGQKNVHAYVCGTYEEAINIDCIEKAYEKLENEGMRRVYYNPYTVSGFVLKGSGEPVEACNECIVIMDRVYIK